VLRSIWGLSSGSREGHGNKQVCWVSTPNVAPVSSWHCHPFHLSSTTTWPCLLDCWPLLQSYDMHCSVLPDMLRHKNRRSHSRFLHSSSLDGCNCKWSIYNQQELLGFSDRCVISYTLTCIYMLLFCISIIIVIVLLVSVSRNLTRHALIKALSCVTALIIACRCI